MTLVVSLRVTDGVVLAADSLATSFQALKMQVSAQAKCPSCQETVDIPDAMQNLRAHPPCPRCTQPIPLDQLPEPRLNVPISASSYAQKVYPFLDVFGVAQFGATSIGNRTVYSHVKSLEKLLRTEIEHGLDLGNPGIRAQYRDMSFISTRVRDALISTFDAELPPANRGADFPDIYFGIQLVGFRSPTDPTPITVEIGLGKANTFKNYEGLGITASGDWTFTIGFINLCNQHRYNPEIVHFSLQDAIDYSEFLVATMAGMQRFAANTSTVGGAIDIGLLAPYSVFRWIKAKPLARILEPESGVVL
jgi:hypothetical protein